MIIAVERRLATLVKSENRVRNWVKAREAYQDSQITEFANLIGVAFSNVGVTITEGDMYYYPRVSVIGPTTEWTKSEGGSNREFAYRDSASVIFTEAHVSIMASGTRVSRVIEGDPRYTVTTRSGNDYSRTLSHGDFSLQDFVDAISAKDILNPDALTHILEHELKK